MDVEVQTQREQPRLTIVAYQNEKNNGDIGKYFFLPKTTIFLFNTTATLNYALL